MKSLHKGGCLCGAVAYQVKGPLRDALTCHCHMCQRTHGVPATYSAAAKSDFVLLQDRGLKWFASSSFARRGFCSSCGASLFWESLGADYIAIAAGTLDPGSGVKTVGHIFTADQGDYYEIKDGLPQFQGSSGGNLPTAPTVA